MKKQGYSTQQIADKLTALGKRTYKGNIKWTAAGVVSTLRNERYCGDVFTRKTFTRDVLSHRSIKNRGERPRSRYLDEHKAIVSRDDFMAVQMLLNNSKYRNKSFLPELQFIPDGLLKGYVIVNPRWGSFTEEDYQRASATAYDGLEAEEETEMTFEAGKGDFDFSGYEIAQLDVVSGRSSIMAAIEDGSIVFIKECMKKMPGIKNIQLLIHPTKGTIAVRPAPAGDRQAICWIRKSNGIEIPRHIPTTAFSQTLFNLFDWKTGHKYRLRGSLMKNGNEEALLLFTNANATIMIPKDQLANTVGTEEAEPLAARGKRVSAFSGEMRNAFGKDFYEEQTAQDLVRQTAENWQIRIEGRLCATGQRLSITPYDEFTTSRANFLSAGFFSLRGRQVKGVAVS